jgi:hypothetical protein
MRELEYLSKNIEGMKIGYRMRIRGDMYFLFWILHLQVLLLKLL